MVRERMDAKRQSGAEDPQLMDPTGGEEHPPATSSATPEAHHIDQSPHRGRRNGETVDNAGSDGLQPAAARDVRVFEPSGRTPD